MLAVPEKCSDYMAGEKIVEARNARGACPLLQGGGTDRTMSRVSAQYTRITATKGLARSCIV